MLIYLSRWNAVILPQVRVRVIALFFNNMTRTVSPVAGAHQHIIFVQIMDMHVTKKNEKYRNIGVPFCSRSSCGYHHVNDTASLHKDFNVCTGMQTGVCAAMCGIN